MSDGTHDDPRPGQSLLQMFREFEVSVRTDLNELRGRCATLQNELLRVESRACGTVQLSYIPLKKAAEDLDAKIMNCGRFSVGTLQTVARRLKDEQPKAQATVLVYGAFQAGGHKTWIEAMQCAGGFVASLNGILVDVKDVDFWAPVPILR